MKFYNELKWFIFSTLYIWVYYLICVYLNNNHPYEVYVIGVTILSLLGVVFIPYVFFPMFCIYIILWYMSVPLLIFRTIIYYVFSTCLLIIIFTVHMNFSNIVFTKGLVEKEGEVVERLEESIENEIIVNDIVYIKPFTKGMSSLGMSVTNDPAVSIDYSIIDCDLGECDFEYTEYFDKDTWEVLSVTNTLNSYDHSMVESFKGDYAGLRSDKEYLISIVDNLVDGKLMYIRGFDPYFDLIVKVEISGSGIVKGYIIDVNDLDDIFIGKRVDIVRDKDGIVEVIIDGETHIIMK